MDKVVIVTGGSRGIGANIVKELANTGYKVILNYNKSEIEANKIKDELQKNGKIMRTIMFFNWPFFVQQFLLKKKRLKFLHYLINELLTLQLQQDIYGSGVIKNEMCWYRSTWNKDTNY